MKDIIKKNVENWLSGVIKVEMLPDALRCVAVGSRAFVRAVRAFQEAFDLLVDGELGPITMQYIEDSNTTKSVKKKKKQKTAPKVVSVNVDSIEE